MKAKRLLSLLLTAALMLSMVTPVLAASAETELPRASQTRLEETNEVVSIRLQATGKLVYGSPFELSVVTRPADAQYIGVVLGIKGEAKGYVTLVLSDKLRTLLKMIPLPRKMSKTPDQVEEFNVYAYVKQLIDGNDVSVLLGVADEVVKVMDTLKFNIPTLKDMSMGLKLSLELIRRYLPEGAFSRIYLEITNCCNLSCAFCPGTRRARRMLPAEEFRLLAGKLRPWTDYLYLHVLGEPLLHPQLAEILASAGELGFRVCLVTNGTLLAQRRDTLLAAPALHKLSV